MSGDSSDDSSDKYVLMLRKEKKLLKTAASRKQERIVELIAQVNAEKEKNKELEYKVEQLEHKVKDEHTARMKAEKGETWAHMQNYAEMQLLEDEVRSLKRKRNELSEELWALKGATGTRGAANLFGGDHDD